ncbi:MAG: hypothetical protein AAGA80_11120 [Cyanobacteria bacterium P01_F01_bin.143]
MNDQNKNKLQDGSLSPEKDNKQQDRGKIRELTAQERKRLQERLAKAKENDPNIYPIF